MKGSGVLIPKYRPRKQSLQKEYLPCEFCKADFVASVLWKHHKSCPAKSGFVKSTAPVKNSRLILPVSERCSEGFRKDILGKMRDTTISAKLKTDLLIIQYGERRYEKKGKHAHTHQYIMEELRSLGRLLCAISEIDNSITQLQQMLNTQNWELLLKGVKRVAEYDRSTQTFGKPSLAKTLGYYMQECAKIVRINARIAGDKDLKAIAKEFLELYKDDWQDRISSSAYESQSAAQYNKVQRLPLVEDVKKLKEYIEEEITETVQSERFTDVVKHNKLCQLILVQILLFNRKRSGEAQRLTSDAYRIVSVSDSPVDEDVRRCLSPWEQELCSNHTRIETRGKKGRKVAILLTKQMQKNVDILMSLKKENTQYVFQTTHSRHPIRGSDVLRKYANEADLKNPEALTSTSLRKQLATLSQVLNLDENDQDILAKLMGHDLNIHREYYRLPQSTLEITKVSKILHALNTGKIQSIKGKNMDEIDPMEELEREPQSDDEDDENDDDDLDDSVKDKNCVEDQGSDQEPDDSDNDDISAKKSQARIKK